MFCSNVFSWSFNELQKKQNEYRVVREFLSAVVKMFNEISKMKEYETETLFACDKYSTTFVCLLPCSNEHCLNQAYAHKENESKCVDACFPFANCV